MLLENALQWQDPIAKLEMALWDLHDNVQVVQTRTTDIRQLWTCPHLNFDVTQTEKALPAKGKGRQVQLNVRPRYRFHSPRQPYAVLEYHDVYSGACNRTGWIA